MSKFLTRIIGENSMDGQRAGGNMQTINRRALVSDTVSGILFAFMRTYLLLVFAGGAVTLMVISRLFHNIGWALATLSVALILYICFRQ